MTEQDAPRKILFRESALKNISPIEEIHGALIVVGASLKIYMLASLMVLAGLIIWCLCGSVLVEVSAQGILLPARQLVLAEKLYQENSEDRNQALKSMKILLDKKQKLYDLHYLTIDELERAKQDYLKAKENLTVPPRLNNEHLGSLFASEHHESELLLQGLLFVSHTEGKKIKAGMRAFILPAALSSYEHGFIKATVLSISEYPASKESVYSYLGNMNLVDEYFMGGAPFVIKVGLETKENALGQYVWSTQKGASFNITAGTAVNAKIFCHQYHPYQLLLKSVDSG